RYFQRLLESVVEDVEQRIEQVPLLGAEERARLLTEWSGAAVAAPTKAPRLVMEMLQAQAARTPDRAAVECEGRQLTYRQLNSKANQLAHYLRRNYRLDRDELVGVMAEASERFIIGVLGALKAGGAYVPIDPAYPEERRRYILEDAGVKLLLVDRPEVF